MYVCSAQYGGFLYFFDCVLSRYIIIIIIELTN